MGLLDLFKRSAPQQLELGSDMDAWPKELVEQTGLEKGFKRFSEEVQSLQKDLAVAARKLTDEDVLAAVPDRARTMNALHGNEYATQLTKLLQSLHFTDLWSFEKEQAEFLENSNGFKDRTAKNMSVLKEFLSDELKTIQKLLQALEDKVINFAKYLEDNKFPTIRKIKILHTKLAEQSTRGEKYHKLLASLEIDSKRTKDKKAKLEADIAKQQELVRNEGSLQALQKLKTIEEEMQQLATNYLRASEEVKALQKRNQEFVLTPGVKKVVDDLAKDALAALSHPEAVQKAFEDLITQLEDEQPGNTRQLIERLTRLAKSVETDGRNVQTSAPDQRALKKEIMRDIAALQMYDKQQFLLRAKAEEDTLQHKISYITAELDPNKRIVLEQEIRQLVKDLGAKVAA